MNGCSCVFLLWHFDHGISSFFFEEERGEWLMISFCFLQHFKEEVRRTEDIPAGLLANLFSLLEPIYLSQGILLVEIEHRLSTWWANISSLPLRVRVSEASVGKKAIAILRRQMGTCLFRWQSSPPFRWVALENPFDIDLHPLSTYWLTPQRPETLQWLLISLRWLSIRPIK